MSAVPEAGALVAAARRLALAAHGDQRYGQAPYRVHLEHVVSVVERYPHNEVMRASAWLHDVVEDTQTTLDEVRSAVGDEVAAIVAAVTDEPGASRVERKAATYRKLAASSAAARAVKLADRIANLEASARDGREDLRAMYRSEHDAFRSALQRPGEHEAQWTALEVLVR